MWELECYYSCYISSNWGDLVSSISISSEENPDNRGVNIYHYTH